MDNDLDSLADNIIKDSFGSAAPSAPAPSTSTQDIASNSTPETMPKAPEVTPATAPATPRETFTAEVPTSEPMENRAAPSEPVSNPSEPSNPPESVSPSGPSVANPSVSVGPADGIHSPLDTKTNEYSRIKEQMSAARENSNIPNVAPAPGQPTMPKQGLNLTILLFIILIPVVVVATGLIIALVNQPSSAELNDSENASRPTVAIPEEETEENLDESITSEIKDGGTTETVESSEVVETPAEGKSDFQEGVNPPASASATGPDSAGPAEE